MSTRTYTGIAVLAERLRRTLKARVRKSVGSIPTDCNTPFFFVVQVLGLPPLTLRWVHFWLRDHGDAYVRV